MFYSILFPTPEDEKPLSAEEPECFRDLNLGQVFAPILKKKADFELAPLYYTPLQDAAVIRYRQQVIRELEDDDLREKLTDFSERMLAMRRQLEHTRKAAAESKNAAEDPLVQGKLLRQAEEYCVTVDGLTADLRDRTLQAEGLRLLLEYLEDYCASEAFVKLKEWVGRLREQFSKVHYCMYIRGRTMKLRKFEGQRDRTEEITALFEKFRQGEVQDYRLRMPEFPYDEKVETTVLQLLAGLYPKEFGDLKTFFAAFSGFDDGPILRFSREIQFYLGWQELLQPLKRQGLSFCCPEICADRSRLFCSSGFDLALALRIGSAVVPNDFRLDDPEQILVLTGPNQGGKTTFARAFGQLHYLAALGLSVPGADAAVLLCDNILTHFEREEDLTAMSGKLQDDLIRLRALLDCATGRSIVIINEIFASTTMQDAVTLGTKMMDTLTELGCPGIVVTFLDELAEYGSNTVSMMSTVLNDEAHTRTFKIQRKAPDGLAYAMQLAFRHGLTREQLEGRLKK